MGFKIGYITLLTKKDGTTQILRSDSEHQMKKLRSATCKKLLGKLADVSPMIKDGTDFKFHMFRVAKKVKN